MSEVGRACRRAGLEQDDRDETVAQVSGPGGRGDHQSQPERLLQRSRNLQNAVPLLAHAADCSAGAGSLGG